VTPPRIWCRPQSTTHWSAASAARFSNDSSTFPPVRCSAKSTMVVVPPNAAATVPDSNVSEETVVPVSSCMCTCASTAPGTT
jgi:hypothetical protein